MTQSPVEIWNESLELIVHRDSDLFASIVNNFTSLLDDEKGITSQDLYVLCIRSAVSSHARSKMEAPHDSAIANLLRDFKMPDFGDGQ